MASRSGLGLFLLAMACLWALAGVVARRLAEDSRDRVAIALLVFLLALYALPLAAGVLGRLGPGALLLGVSAAAIATVLLGRRGPASSEVARASPIGIGPDHLLWGAAVVVVLLVEAARYGRRFARLHPLSWDAAQFGLPNAIRFAQLGTLWPIDSPGFGLSYPYGYELSVIWPIVFTRSEALLGMMHALFCAAVILYSYLLCERMLGRIPAATKALVAASVATSLLLVPGIKDVFAGVGKADVAVAAFGLAAMYCLLRAAEGAGLRFFILAGAALGLAAGSKATGLAYCAAFSGALVLIADRAAPARGRTVSAVFREQSAILGPAVLVGGFWYARNWLVAGHPTGDLGLARIGWQRSIAGNLLQPAFYRLDIPFLVFATACVAAVATAMIAMRRWRAGAKDRVGFALFASALSLSVVIFCLTPFSAYGTFPDGPFQLRLSGIMIPLLVVAAGLCLARILGRRPLMSGPTGVPLWQLSLPTATHGPNGVTVAWALGGLVVFVGMSAQHLLYVPPEGLPGYERILGEFSEPTRAYAWARRELHGRSILSLYVSPYGLMGPDFSNGVVYFLHADSLPVEWVRTAVQRYAVDHVFVGKNPNPGFETAGRFPPLATAIAREPGFAEVFRDSQVVVYRTPHSSPGAAP